MKITPKNVKKFQQGGPMEAPAEQPMEQAPEQAPEQGASQDPLVMLAEAAVQALQSQDCQIAMQVCQGLIQLLQQMSDGAQEEPQGEPVYRKGGVLVRRIKK